ncbi:hypothetical protein ASC68_18830 [Devosia sp. Root105]|nr:hypothetical protein ASC68_18830 [Devosia sp. Root105]
MLDGVIAGADFRKIKVSDAIERIDKKIGRWEAVQMKVTLYTAVPYLLLFCSIVGVSLEIQFLGITLKGIEKLKELIFVSVSLAGLYFGMLESGLKKLRKLRERLYRQRYGEKAGPLLKYLVEDESPYTNMDVYISGERYLALPAKLIVEGVRGVSIMVTLLLGFAIYLYITLVVALDLWNHSNWPGVWGQVLVAVVFIIATAQTTATVLKTAFRFRYVDTEKSAKLAVADPETGEIVQEIKDMINKDVRFWRGIRIVATVAIVLVFYAWFFFGIFRTPPLV